MKDSEQPDRNPAIVESWSGAISNMSHGFHQAPRGAALLRYCLTAEYEYLLYP